MLSTVRRERSVLRSTMFKLVTVALSTSLLIQWSLVAGGSADVTLKAVQDQRRSLLTLGLSSVDRYSDGRVPDVVSRLSLSDRYSASQLLLITDAHSIEIWMGRVLGAKISLPILLESFKDQTNRPVKKSLLDDVLLIVSNLFPNFYFLSSCVAKIKVLVVVASLMTSFLLLPLGIVILHQLFIDKRNS